MSTIEKINEDLKNAMFSHNTELVSVLRLIKSALKNTEISKKYELSETDVLSVIEKQAKQRKDSIAQYEAGGRDDLAAKEKSELNILNNYIPQKLSEEETSKIIDEILSDKEDLSMSQMGQIIKEVMIKADGKADGSLVSKLVKEKIS